MVNFGPLPQVCLLGKKLSTHGLDHRGMIKAVDTASWNGAFDRRMLKKNPQRVSRVYVDLFQGKI